MCIEHLKTLRRGLIQRGASAVCFSSRLESQSAWLRLNVPCCFHLRNTDFLVCFLLVTDSAF